MSILSGLAYFKGLLPGICFPTSFSPHRCIIVKCHVKYFLEKSKNCRHPISTNRRPHSVPLPTCSSSIQKCWVLPLRHSTHTRGAGLTKLVVCGVNIAMNFEYCNTGLWILQWTRECCHTKEGTDYLAALKKWITQEPFNIIGGLESDIWEMMKISE